MPPNLLFTLLSFIANSVFLTLYFSIILSDGASKYAPHKDAFLLSFLGSAVGAAFSLVIPYLPEILPYMDVAVTLVVVTWILLLHYYYGSDWTESVLEAAIAAIIYIVILAITFGFWILWVEVS